MFSSLMGATLYVTCESGGDYRHHFFKVEFTIFQSILSFTILQRYAQRCNCKRIVFFLLPEAFCGLKHAENAIAAGAPPRTPLAELTTLPRPPSRLGRGHPSPYPTPLDAFGSSCPPVTKSWRRHWSPALHCLR